MSTVGFMGGEREGSSSFYKLIAKINNKNKKEGPKGSWDGLWICSLGSWRIGGRWEPCPWCEQQGLLPAPCMGKVPPGCVPPQEVLVPLSPAQLEGRTGLLFPALHTDLQTCLRSFVCLVVIERGGDPSWPAPEHNGAVASVCVGSGARSGGGDATGPNSALPS